MKQIAVIRAHLRAGLLAAGLQDREIEDVQQDRGDDFNRLGARITVTSGRLTGYRRGLRVAVTAQLSRRLRWRGPITLIVDICGSPKRPPEMLADDLLLWLADHKLYDAEGNYVQFPADDQVAVDYATPDGYLLGDQRLRLTFQAEVSSYADHQARYLTPVLEGEFTPTGDTHA